MEEKIDFDPFEVLHVAIDATVAEIQRAYKKLALKYHPDRNPNNDDAASMFLRIFKAKEILTDEKQRADFLTRVKAQQMQKARVEKMDAGRRKMKEELEARERAAQQKQQQQQKQPSSMRASVSVSAVERKKMEEEIRKLREENVKFMDALPHKHMQKRAKLQAHQQQQQQQQKQQQQHQHAESTTPSLSGSSSQASGGDFESIVLMRMRQAQERKRLLEQLEKEEAEEEAEAAE